MEEHFNFHLATVEVLGNSREKENSKPNVFNIRTNIIASLATDDSGITLPILDNISKQAVDQVKQQFSHLIVEANNVVILSMSFLGCYTKEEFGYKSKELEDEVIIDNEATNDSTTH